MISGKYTKKLLGTSFLVAVILSLSLISYSFARAQDANNKSYKFDGDVVTISEYQLAITTEEGSIVTFVLNDKTTFSRIMNWTDIEAGDFVYVIAKEDNGIYTADVVQADNRAAYGRDQ